MTRREKIIIFTKSFLTTTSILLSILLSTYVIKTTFYSNEEKPDYKVKIEELNNISKSLNDLSKYIEGQKKAIEEFENSVNQLKKEKSELEPIVESNRQLVESFFSEHDKHVNKNIWFERVMAFVLGIFSSVIASLTYDYFKRRQIKITYKVKSD